MEETYLHFHYSSSDADHYFSVNQDVTLTKVTQSYVNLLLYQNSKSLISILWYLQNKNKSEQTHKQTKKICVLMRDTQKVINPLVFQFSHM